MITHVKMLITSFMFEMRNVILHTIEDISSHIIHIVIYKNISKLCVHILKYGGFSFTCQVTIQNYFARHCYKVAVPCSRALNRVSVCLFVLHPFTWYPFTLIARVHFCFLWFCLSERLSVCLFVSSRPVYMVSQ